jgi:hypothetical protein
MFKTESQYGQKVSAHAQNWVLSFPESFSICSKLGVGMSKKTLLGQKIGSVHAEKFLVGLTIWSCLAKKI